jgi:hypothetical protein
MGFIRKAADKNQPKKFMAGLFFFACDKTIIEHNDDAFSDIGFFSGKKITRTWSKSGL